MPGFDGRGPEGRGQMTGGGRGFCALPAGDVTVNPRRGVGSFPGGRGRGRRNIYRAAGLTRWQRYPGAASGDIESLKREAEMLKAELDEVQIHIGEMGSSEQH